MGRRIGKGRLKNEEVSDGLEEETRFVWDGSHLLQEVQPDGRYTYLYTDPDSYEPLAQVHNHTNTEGESRQQILYFHCDQIGIPREMTDKDGNLLWFGNYTGWGRLKEETKVTDSAYQPFRLQNQYADHETGLHYNFFRYYEPDAGRFVNQDPIGLLGGENLYWFASNITSWIDPLGLESILVFLTKVSAKQNTGAVSFLNVNGRIYKGVSGKVPKKLHPELKKALNKIESSVPNIPGWYGKCAEVAAINKALKKGEKLDGATIETLNLAKDNRFGKPKHACATCNPLLAMFRITATSG